MTLPWRAITHDDGTALLSANHTIVAIVVFLLLLVLVVHIFIVAASSLVGGCASMVVLCVIPCHLWDGIVVASPIVFSGWDRRVG